MTRRRRATPLLAILAALIWAPSAVHAAPPNQLSQPVAEPPAGTTLTTFHLSVRYRSTAGNAATAVSVDIGPLTLDLGLVAGSADDGRWAGSTTLPAGSWPVTFRASTARGPKPVLDGPTLTVAVPAPLASTAEPTPQPTPRQGTASPAARDADPPVEASAEPKAAGTPALSAAPEAPADGASDGSVENGAPSGAPADEKPAAGGARASPSAVAPPQTSGAIRAVEGPSPRPIARAAPTGAREPASQQPFAPTGPFGMDAALLLLIGIMGVAAVALVSMGWLLASDGGEDEEPAASDEPSPAAAPAVSAAVAAISDRRTMRRARLRSSSDPIIASMGLEPSERSHAAPRRRTSKVEGPSLDDGREARPTRPRRRER